MELVVTKDPHTYAGRLAIAIEEAQITVRDLSRRLDVSPQSLYKVMRGESRSLQASNHLKAAKFLGVEPRWLADGIGPMLAPKQVSLEGNPDYPAVRHISMRFSAGISGYAVQQVDERASQPIVFRASWFSSRGYRPARVVAVTVAGQSMEPTLYDGDLAIINLDDTTPKEGEVYAVRYEDEMVIKRLFRAGGWWLHSDSPDQRRHPKREATESVEILGRVVYRQSERL